MRRRGVVIVWIAMILVGLAGMLALALDTGLVALAKGQLQAAADSAALAGAAQLYAGQDNALPAATELAAANRVLGDTVDLPAQDVVVGRYDRYNRVFTPRNTRVNAVKVTTRREGEHGVPLILGPVVGVSITYLNESSIAMVNGGKQPSLVALDPTAECSLRTNGSPTLEVVNAETGEPESIIVYSDAECAACVSGGSHPEIETSAIDSAGGICMDSANWIGGEPELFPNSPSCRPIVDPLAYLPDIPEEQWFPVWFANGRMSNTRDLTILPGYYPNGIRRTGGTLTLAPGIYIIGGDGMEIAGSAAVDGTRGVMLYLVGSASIKLNGSAPVELVPPDPAVNTFPGADIYAGVAIFQARGNTTTASLAGTPGLNIQGALYFPSNTVDITGTAENFGTQLVANQIELGGNGLIRIASSEDSWLERKPFLVD